MISAIIFIYEFIINLRNQNFSFIKSGYDTSKNPFYRLLEILSYIVFSPITGLFFNFTVGIPILEGISEITFFAVFGNHEFYEGYPHYQEMLDTIQKINDFIFINRAGFSGYIDKILFYLIKYPIELIVYIYYSIRIRPDIYLSWIVFIVILTIVSVSIQIGKKQNSPFSLKLKTKKSLSEMTNNVEKMQRSCHVQAYLDFDPQDASELSYSPEMYDFMNDFYKNGIYDFVKDCILYGEEEKKQLLWKKDHPSKYNKWTDRDENRMEQLDSGFMKYAQLITDTNLHPPEYVQPSMKKYNNNNKTES